MLLLNIVVLCKATIHSLVRRSKVYCPQETAASFFYLEGGGSGFVLNVHTCQPNFVTLHPYNVNIGNSESFTFYAEIQCAISRILCTISSHSVLVCSWSVVSGHCAVK
jgi:hypothetical protein